MTSHAGELGHAPDDLLAVALLSMRLLLRLLLMLLPKQLQLLLHLSLRLQLRRRQLRTVALLLLAVAGLRRGGPIIRVFFFFPFGLFDCCRLESNHTAVTLLAFSAPSPVLADATAAAVFATVALPPVLAEAAATAVLATSALPP